MATAANCCPRIWYEPPMRVILADRDVTALYRGLNDRGVSQHQIARWTGQGQSEASEILKGRPQSPGTASLGCRRS